MNTSSIASMHNASPASHGLLLLVIVLLAATIRTISFSAVYPSSPDSIISPDTPRYEQPAVSLVVDADMRDGLPVADTQDIHVAPGYPVFMAALYTLFSDGRAAVIYAQIIVSALSILVIFLCARDAFGSMVGLYAAALFSLDPLQFLYSQILLTETLFVFCVILVMWMALRLILLYDSDKRLRYAALLGLSLGLATLVRPVSYYLVFCLLFGVIIYHLMQRHKLSALLPVSLLITLGFASAVAPWHIRNGQLTGSYVFTDNPSVILYYWKAAGMVAYRDGLDASELRKTLKSEMPTSYASIEEKMALEKQLGIDIIASDIPSYLRFTADGVFRIAIGPGLAKFGKFFDPQNIGQSHQEASTELPAGSCSLICNIENRLGFKIWYLGIIGYSLAFVCTLYLLATFGAASKLGKKSSEVSANTTVIVLLLCMAAYFVFASSGHSAADSRMRTPVMPMLVILAAIGLHRLIHGRKQTLST